MANKLDTLYEEASNQVSSLVEDNSVEQKLVESFNRVMAKLKAHIGTDAFQSWFGRVQLEPSDNVIIRLSVATSFLKSWINSHYNDMLLKFWQCEYPSILRIEIIVRSVGKPVMEVSLSNQAFAPSTSISKHVENTNVSAPRRLSADNMLMGSPLDKRYSFDNFVEGTSNRLALAAARSIADASPNHEQFSPLFIHANVGLGKTHLLQSIATEAKNNNKYGVVVYLTAEYFMWRFATAIRDNKALSLKEQLRDIHLLVIDDLQFLQGKSIQNEFCHLLNMLLDSAKKIVVAADRPPAELESLDPRVRSRLQRGVTLSIDTPDYDMRLHMLKNRLKLAQQHDSNFNIDEEKLAHIARMISGSGRDIEGVFNQIVFRQSFEGKLSIEKIDELLGQVLNTNEAKKIRIEEIQQVVARHYNLSKNDLLSSRRIRTIVKPRQIAMYLAKNLTPRSLPEIGRRFGGRDHTTVLHAIRKIETKVGKDNKLEKELELLKRLINDQGL